MLWVKNLTKHHKQLLYMHEKSVVPLIDPELSILLIMYAVSADAVCQTAVRCKGKEGEKGSL